jgi:chromosome segregation ATPase
MQQSSANNGVRVIELRERHSRTEHQLQQMRNFLAQQSAEKQQLAHVIAQAAAKNVVLDAELKSLQSDLDMANLEYADVSVSK